MKTLALLMLLVGPTAVPIPKYVWMGDNPNGKMLRPMYVQPTTDLIERIVAKTATLSEIQELFAHSPSDAYLDAFMRSDEVTAIATAAPGSPGFGQLLVSKKDGVTSYWFLRERNGRDGCMEVFAHFSDGPDSGGDLRRADAAAGPATGGLVMLTWGVARLCQ